MSTDKQQNETINDYLRNSPGRSLKFTVHQHGRTRKVTATTSSGETFEDDAINDALYRVAELTDASNGLRGDAKGGGTA